MEEMSMIWHIRSLRRTKNSCSGVVAHIAVGNLYKKHKAFLLEVFRGGCNSTLSKYTTNI